MQVPMKENPPSIEMREVKRDLEHVEEITDCAIFLPKSFRDPRTLILGTEFLDTDACIHVVYIASVLIGSDKQRLRFSYIYVLS